MSGRMQMRLLGLAMAVPPLAWYAYQQGLGVLLRVDCGRGGGWTGPVWGLCAVAACVAAGLVSRFAARPEEGEGRRQIQRLITVLTASSAALFALAILYQLAATTIVPSCVR